MNKLLKSNYIDNSSNLHFFVEIDNIEKAKDKNGKDVMKVGGIASTSNVDSEGEVLDPNGFDFKPFLTNGYLNWHHQSAKNPMSIVGEPTKAEVRPEGFYIEGLLYPDNPMSKQIYNLANVLKKNSSKRSLGFSIEGRATKRNQLNPKKIEQAVITGCAITHAPINKNTALSILKGENWSEEPPQFEIVQKFESNVNGGNIIELERDGKVVIVDCNWNIKIEQVQKSNNMSAVAGDVSGDVSGDVAEKSEQEEEETEKSLNTTNGAALLPESLDSKVKVQKGSKNKVMEGTIFFDQTEVLNQIKSDFSGINDQDVQHIVNIANAFNLKIQKSVQMDNMISNESLSKAYDALGLVVPGTEGDINKAGGTGRQDPSVAQQSQNVTSYGKETLKENKSPEYYFKKSGDCYRKMYKGEDGEEKFADDEKYRKTGKNKFAKMKKADTVAKSEDIVPINADTVIEEVAEVVIEKAVETKASNNEDAINKAFEALGIRQEEVNKAQGTILKSVVDDVKEIKELLTELRQPATGKRTVSKAGAMQVLSRNFDSGEATIQKATGEGHQTSTGFDLRNKVHRDHVSNVLDQMTFEKGSYDDALGNACLALEQGATTLPNAIIAQLKAKGVEIAVNA